MYQQVENHLLQPFIQRRTLRMNPLLIALAMLAGTAFAGILGALLALPVAGALQILAQDLLAHRQARWARRGRMTPSRFRPSPRSPRRRRSRGTALSEPPGERLRAPLTREPPCTEAQRLRPASLLGGGLLRASPAAFLAAAFFAGAFLAAAFFAGAFLAAAFFAGAFLAAAFLAAAFFAGAFLAAAFFAGAFLAAAFFAGAFLAAAFFAGAFFAAVRAAAFLAGAAGCSGPPGP